MYFLFIIKRIIEDVFIFPFVLTGRLLGRLRPLDKEFRVFFFFPFYHVGGAEKVHAQVARACGGSDCIIFFTRKSHNGQFIEEFRKSGCTIKDISRYTDNKWLYFINLVFRGIISGYINRQALAPDVFNGQCNFAYKLSPWIKKEIPQIELIHSLNSFSYIRIPFLAFISKTVMISMNRIEDHKRLYKRMSIPDKYVSRIHYIANAVPLPEKVPFEKKGPFTVLYSGRGGVEKRIYLIAEIAKKLYEDDNSYEFEILGDVSNIISSKDYPFIRFHGFQNDGALIEQVYRNSNVLLLTSTTEGFPMVVIEAMAHGCAIVATPVGDIPMHVKNGINGFLFSDSANEKQIIEEGVNFISRLRADKDLFKRISDNNIEYAYRCFNIELFNEAYRKVFER